MSDRRPPFNEGTLGRGRLHPARRRRALAVVAALLWAAGVPGGLLPDAAASPLDRTVCPSGPPACGYAKIQDAVVASEPGDTVLVKDGTYLEQVTIPAAKTGLILCSAPGLSSCVTPPWEPSSNDRATIQFSGGFAAVRILADNVTFRGFAVRGESPAGNLEVQGASGVTIERNIVGLPPAGTNSSGGSAAVTAVSIENAPSTRLKENRFQSDTDVGNSRIDEILYGPSSNGSDRAIPLGVHASGSPSLVANDNLFTNVTTAFEFISGGQPPADPTGYVLRDNRMRTGVVTGVVLGSAAGPPTNNIVLDARLNYWNTNAFADVTTKVKDNGTNNRILQVPFLYANTEGTKDQMTPAPFFPAVLGGSVVPTTAASCQGYDADGDGFSDLYWDGSSCTFLSAQAAIDHAIPGSSVFIASASPKTGGIVPRTEALHLDRNMLGQALTGTTLKGITEVAAWSALDSTSNAPHAVVTSPDGSRVFVAGSATTLAKDAATGATLWSVATPGGNAVALDATGATLYVGASNVWALNASDGSVLWNTATTPGAQDVELAGSLVFAATNVGTMAFDTASSPPGAQIWTTARRSNRVAVSPDGSRVYVSDRPTSSAKYRVDTFDATTGNPGWSTTLTATTTFARDLGLSPDGTRVFLTGSTGGNYLTAAFDATTGAVLLGGLWQKTFNGPAGSNSWCGTDDQAFKLLVSPTRVFVTGQSCVAYGLDGDAKNFRYWDWGTVAYDASTGTELWRSFFDGEGGWDDKARGMALSPDGATLYVAGTTRDHIVNPAVVSYDAATGEQLIQRMFDLARIPDEASQNGSIPDTRSRQAGVDDLSPTLAVGGGALFFAGTGAGVTLRYDLLGHEDTSRVVIDSTGVSNTVLTAPAANTTVRGLGLTHTGTPTAPVVGVDVSDASGVTFQNNAIHLEGGGCDASGISAGQCHGSLPQVTGIFAGLPPTGALIEGNIIAADIASSDGTIGGTNGILAGMVDSRIEGNTFTDWGANGAYISHGSNVTVRNNTFDTNGDGILVCAPNSRLTANVFRGDFGAVVGCQAGTGLVLRDNDLGLANDFGVRLPEGIANLTIDARLNYWGVTDYRLLPLRVLDENVPSTNRVMQVPFRTTS